MVALNASVGRAGVNSIRDVRAVQQLLNGHIGQLTPLAPLVTDGIVGTKTTTLIETFQQRVVGMAVPDGRVDPTGATLRALNAPPPIPPSLQRMSFDVQTFLTRIDQTPELRDARVLYYGDEGTCVLRTGASAPDAGQPAVIVRRGADQATATDPTLAQSRDAKLLSELLGLGLSCSSAYLGWAVVVSSGATVPLTGGSSAFITYLGYAAATASTAQCINAVVRTVAEYEDPAWLDILDSQTWYQKTSLAVDALCVAGAVSSSATTVKLALSLRASTGKSLIQVLQGLSRQQRKQLAEEVIRDALPGISGGELKALVRAGVYPKRYSPAQISATVYNQLRDAAGAAITFAGSAVSGVVREAANLTLGYARSLEIP